MAGRHTNPPPPLTVPGYAFRYLSLVVSLDAGSTRIKYMTDGVLLREAMGDPLLSAYSAIVLDEVKRSRR